MSEKKNVIYGDCIAEYFRDARSRWSDFYPSERWVFETVFGAVPPGRVLDVGCAAGGLGLALAERFRMESYTGVDISGSAIALARSRSSRFKVPASFHCGDILEMNRLTGAPFDTVFSLSCADWNIRTEEMIDACWSCVSPQGRLIMSLRLTDLPGTNDPSVSYQKLGRDDNPDQRANYVVFNVRDVLKLLERLDEPASHVLAYGYWGTPSDSAVTPYARLVFAVFAVTKRKPNEGIAAATTELRLPLSLFTGS